MKCEICNKGTVPDGVSLYRVNKLGVTGIWRCAEHLTPEQKQAIDPEVKEIVETIEASNNRISNTANT